MTLSPCRNCPNRDMDKNLCVESCDLLNRIQTVLACRMQPAAWSAVDSADEGRYRLSIIHDARWPSMDGLSL